MVRAKEIIIEEGSISMGYPKCIVVVEAMRSTRMSCYPKSEILWRGSMVSRKSNHISHGVEVG